jgi:hypothetical protein
MRMQRDVGPSLASLVLWNRQANQGGCKGPGRKIHGTAQPLYARFSIIFSSCFSKVTIGYNPSRAPRPLGQALSLRPWCAHSHRRLSH